MSDERFPILDQWYWSERLRNAPDRNPHHALFECSDVKWKAIAAKHREILARYVSRDTSVLDAGCGWGRLIDMMPPCWTGDYVGVDLSKHMVARARAQHHDRTFIQCDLRHINLPRKYDLAVLISIRGMVINNLGGEVWQDIEASLRRAADKILYLEYNEVDEGVLE